MSGSSYRPLSHASLQPEVLFTSVLCIGSMPAIASAIRLDWPQFQTSLYNQLVSERTQARKSAMAGNWLKSSWLWRGTTRRLAGELLHHLTFLKPLHVINLSVIDVTYFIGGAGQLWGSPSLCIPGVTAAGMYRLLHNTTLALP